MASEKVQVDIVVAILDGRTQGYRIYPGGICGATDARHRPSSTRMSSHPLGLQSVCKACGEHIVRAYTPEDDTTGFWSPWATSTD